jgi:hypothetical protein
MSPSTVGPSAEVFVLTVYIFTERWKESTTPAPARAAPVSTYCVVTLGIFAAVLGGRVMLSGVILLDFAQSVHAERRRVAEAVASCPVAALVLNDD